MIGPAELEDILLDLQAAALEAGATLQLEMVHPCFVDLAELRKPQLTADQSDDAAS